MPDALTFATALLNRGIEFTLRGNRLWVWPGKAYKHLSDDERNFIRKHRTELKALAASRLLPEATVTWTPPDSEAQPSSPDAEPVNPALKARDAELKERDLDTWLVLHGNEPDAVEIRIKRDTEIMQKTMLRTFGCEPPYL